MRINLLHKDNMIKTSTHTVTNKWNRNGNEYYKDIKGFFFNFLRAFESIQLQLLDS